MKKIGVVMLLSFAIVACNSAKKDTKKDDKKDEKEDDKDKE